MRVELEAVGHLTWDVNDGRAWSPGGSVGFAARAWRGLGAHARVVTVVGPDGPDEPAALVGAGRAKQTTRFENRYGASGDRVQQVVCQAGPVRPRHRPVSWATPAARFLAPVLGEVAAQPWLRLPAGLKVVGLQGWLKRTNDRGQVVHGPMGVNPRQFRGADVACLSEEDLAGELGWLDALLLVVPRVALTRGVQGCVLFERYGATRLGVVEVQAVDPTGAGDSFAAGLVMGLVQGMRFGAAARLGAAVASVVVERVGPARPHAFAGVGARAAAVR
jgi:hypothetical protein